MKAELLKRISALVVILFFMNSIHGQELDPRLYANLPKKMNAVALYYGYMSGNVVSDPSLPIEDFKIKSHNIAAAYVHTFSLAKKLARYQISLPYTMMDGNVKINGRDTSGARDGFGDIKLRFGINLIGSPAIDRKDFRKYKQKTIVGFSLVASLPTGLYYSDKKINIGSNRWTIKPEIGISRRFSHIYAEGYLGVWFYGNNRVYLTDKLLKQAPVFTLQAHSSYYFKNQIWIGVDANWFNGGKTTINNKSAGDLKDNWRVGATLSTPITKSQSLKFQVNAGAFKNTGLNYDIFSVSYQYVFF